MAIDDHDKDSAKPNRALLQTANSTQLSYSCSYLINRLNLTDTAKELLLESTQKLIDKISPKDFEEVSKYVSSLEGGDINKAAQALTKNFGGIAQNDIINLLREVHDRSPNKGEFISFINTCIEQNPNLTRSPTNAPTHRPTQNPTTSAPTPPTQSPTTKAPTSQPTSPPTPPFTDGQLVGIISGGTVGSLIVLYCCIGGIAIAAEEIGNALDKRRSAKQVAPEREPEKKQEIELKQVTIHQGKRPPTSPTAATAGSVESKDPSSRQQ